MATAYPALLDTYVDPPATPTTTALGSSTPTHSAFHKDTIDAIHALEAKVGATSSAVTTSLDYKVTHRLVVESNLSDLANATTARTNLGLGTAATANLATSGDAASGEVVKGDDSRLSNSRAPSGAAGGVLSGTYPNPGFAVDMATQAELNAAVALDIPLTQKGAASGVASLDASSRLIISQTPITGGATAGPSMVHWNYTSTYTQTSDPTNAAQGTGLLISHSPVFNYVGEDQVGPRASMSSPLNLTPRGIVEVEGRATYNFSAQTYGYTPMAFVNHLVVRNQPGQARTLNYFAGFLNSPIYEADGATVTAVQTDVTPGGAGFYEQTNILTKNVGVWNGTTNSVWLHSFVSAPAAGGSVTIPGRIAFDVRDVRKDLQNDANATLGAAYDDNDATWQTQIGVNIPLLVNATTNIGIRNGSTTVWTPDTQNLTAAGNTITATATLKIVTLASALTLTSTPHIADGQDGQLLILINGDSADSLTLRDQTAIASNLRLPGAANLVLGPRDTATFVYSSTVGDWVCVGTTNN